MEKHTAGFVTPSLTERLYKSGGREVYAGRREDGLFFGNRVGTG